MPEKENSFSSNAPGEGCTVIFEYPLMRTALETTKAAASKRVDTFSNADVLVLEEEKILQITDGKTKSAIPLRFALSHFMYFNSHAGRGKIGLKFSQSRLNPKEVLVLISSDSVSLIQELNEGVLASQRSHLKGREKATPIASPNKWSPDSKKIRQPSFATPAGSRGSSIERIGLGGVPIGRFGFAQSASSTPKPRLARFPKSPQLNLGSPGRSSSSKPVFSFPTPSSAVLTDLSSEQRAVVDAVLKGESIFFTGGGGTGKSFLLKKLISILPAATTAVTASTGIAACHIDGTTLHHFVGLGRVDPGVPGMAQQILARLRKSPERAEAIRKTKTLIIDEISLIDAKLFELINEVLSAVRTNPKPFGGLQLVLSGDFLQLPPVPNKDAATVVKFCFQSKIWRKSISKSVQLTQIYRQADEAFATMLNEVRFGTCSDETARTLLRRVKHANRSDAGSLKLLPLNKEVAELNEREMSRFPRDVEKQTFTAFDTVFDSQFSLDAVCPVKANITLTIGCRVILVATISASEKLVNGSVGTVVRFSKSPSAPFVQFDSIAEPVNMSMHEWIFKQNGREIARRRQIPLALAWGVSIHKSQGMTLESCEVSLDRIFEAGQAYVALSRCKSLEGLSIISNNPQSVTVRSIQKSIRANPTCIEFYNTQFTKI